MDKDGLTIVYTGKGKGKTTAALGIALRATGYAKKICMIQFIKGSWHYGEMYSSKRLEPEFEMVAIGKGFVGVIDDKSPKEEHERIAKEAIKIRIVKIQDVLNLIKSKPRELDLILTGNYAKDEIIELADLVTEMREIKHPFQRGIKAKKGIDF